MGYVQLIWVTFDKETHTFQVVKFMSQPRNFWMKEFGPKQSSIPKTFHIQVKLIKEHCKSSETYFYFIFVFFSRMRRIVCCGTLITH